MSARLVLALPAVLLFLAACSETAGPPVDVKDLGYRECRTDADCEPYGYCNDDGYCDNECRRDSDCSLSYSDWENYACHHYRCVARASLEDGDEADGDGDGACEPHAVEGRSCHYWTPEECVAFGWPEHCGDMYCLDLGWRHACASDGRCMNNCVIDYGAAEPDSAIAAYVGVYASLFTTAVRNNGLPLVGFQDTVSIHYALTRIREKDGKMIITHKLCRLGMFNFKGDLVVTDDIAMMMVPEAYYETVALVQHVVENPPAREAGASFETDRFWEIRGAKMTKIPCQTDGQGAVVSCEESLPDRDDYAAGDPRIWDQDFDGKPALTTIMAGALNGEVYSDQRWSTQWRAEVLDENRLWGLHDHTSETHNLDATHELLMTEVETVIHADADRSYYRLQRIDDFADCEDVLRLADDEDEWIHFTPHLDPETPLVIPED
ncbi:MAG: hypothetical protein C4523_19880 [Myxococcales bacterium]|nr:MAG: hypothetical protein C4523_19880 [Myxococcales bacterium]